MEDGEDVKTVYCTTLGSADSAEKQPLDETKTCKSAISCITYGFFPTSVLIRS